MKKTVCFLIIPILLFLWACSDDVNDSDNFPDAKPVDLRSELRPRIEQDNLFAWDLFKTLSGETEDPNIFISPLSVSMALSMTMNGAKGATREEMETALRISGFSEDEINEYCKTLREALLKADPLTQINIANSIWYHMGFPVENYFVQTNKIHFNAEVREVDFMDPQTTDRINRWCADNTNNKIPKIIDGVSADVVMYLINAIYFKGMWRMKFEKNNTQLKPFYTAEGQSESVKMMKMTSEFNYTSDNQAGYLELPYGNNAFSMVVILPHEDKTIDDVVANLNADAWNRNLKTLGAVKVNLELPCFKSECEYRLPTVLNKMGMVIPFTRLADFRGISRGGGLSISDVIHKTFIEVNEEGTEAAAVTVVSMFTSSSSQQQPPVIDFFVNKPFLYVIKENSTNVILFAGKMSRP
ncbi:MAG: serpin family protein [Dysgonamonadaceae bacterium]|jgi:serpin B|nr:serpin family protein [Dysgonamonadaceae bacterium]